MRFDNIETLREIYPNLTHLEKRVADYFLENISQLTDTPILDVAEACTTNKPAVVRFCKKLGHKGYKDFQKALSAELALLRHRERPGVDSIYMDSSPQDICTIVTHATVEALEKTLRTVDMFQLERVADMLAEAGRIDLYAVSNSSMLAQDAEMKFRRIGFNAYAPVDTHRQVVSAATLKKGDVVIVFSYYGETLDMLEVLGIAKKQGATVITVTRKGNNSISGEADIALAVDSPEKIPRTGSMTARFSMLLVLDMLFTLLISRRYEQLKEVLEDTSAVSFRKMKTVPED